MLVLDENLPEGQRLWRRKWRIRFRVIGLDVASSGTKDENLIPVLHRLANPTFFTWITTSIGPIGRIRNTAWCGWMSEADRRQILFAAFCDTLHSTLKTNEWVLSRGSTMAG
jgi:hypothetical protein